MLNARALVRRSLLVLHGLSHSSLMLLLDIRTDVLLPARDEPSLGLFEVSCIDALRILRAWRSICYAYLALDSIQTMPATRSTQ